MRVSASCSYWCRPVYNNSIVLSLPPPASPIPRRTSVLPSLTPGQALECYNCKLGFFSLCITTKKTCDSGEHCFSGVGKAGEEPRRRKSHPATFCTVGIGVRPHPATAQLPATMRQFSKKIKKNHYFTHILIFFFKRQVSSWTPLYQFGYFSLLLFFSVDFW